MSLYFVSMCFFFFFSSRRRHTRSLRDWSSRRVLFRSSFWPIWIAGALGAAFGDWLSYWIGFKLGPPVAHIWPLSRHPDLLPKGEAFVKHWGPVAIFIGRFFGPLRASVPLVAGIF